MRTKKVYPSAADETVGLPLFEFCDPKVRDSEETPRLAAQCQLILDRLKAGRATNRELAEFSLKYTSRISDLRASGHDIECVSVDRKHGLSIYELRSGA